jgi:hypothetical protein
MPLAALKLKVLELVLIINSDDKLGNAEMHAIPVSI